MSQKKEKMKKRTSSKNDDMPGARDVAKVGKHRSFVLYGRSGSGKTTLAASFPSPAILLDIRDEGTDSVADVAGLQVNEISSFEEFEEAYWWLKENPTRYKTVIIDTVSQLQQIVVKEIGEKRSRSGKQAGDWGSLTKGDWGDIAARLKEWIINYRDLTKEGMQVVFIAQDRVFNLGDEEDTGDDQIAPEVGPALSPAIAKVLNAAVSIIGNTFIRARVVKKEKKGGKIVKEDKIDYCLRVGPNPVYVTKIRKPKEIAAPAFIINPTYEDLIEVIKGEV